MKKILSIVLVLIILMGMSACNKEQEMLTVTFDSSGGTTIESQTVEEGQCATKPTNPEKEGFTFVEWQFDNKPYDFATPVTSDIILIAVYEVEQGIEVVRVALDYRNGQEEGVVEIIKGGVMTEPPVPQKEGYKFGGWTLGGIRFDFSSAVDEDITLIAEWEVKKSTTESENKNTNKKPSGTKKLLIQNQTMIQTIYPVLMTPQLRVQLQQGHREAIRKMYLIGKKQCSHIMGSGI